MSDLVTYKIGRIVEERPHLKFGKREIEVVEGKRVHVIAIPEFGHARALCTKKPKPFRIDEALRPSDVDCKRCRATIMHARLLELEKREDRRNRVRELMRGGGDV